MAGHGFKSTIAGALMSVAAIFTPLAGAAQEAIMPSAAPSVPESYAAATHDEAKAASVGQIVLHYGEGFPEIAVGALIGALNKVGYLQVEARSGGPADNIALFMDGAYLDRPFDFENSGLIIAVVDHFASHLKSRQTAALPSNDNS